MDDKLKKATRTLRNIFKDFSGEVISREEALKKVSETAFQNNTGPMFSYGLVTYDRDEGKGRKILNIRLTEQGKKALNTQLNIGRADAPDPLTNIDALGEFIKKFNSQNRYWELKLTTKDEPM